MQTEFDYRAMGRRMRDCRAGLGLTQEELAEKAGISASFVGHIERGEKQASVETVVALSKCLEISLDCLLLGRKRLCDPDDCRLREDLQKLVDTYILTGEIPFDHLSACKKSALELLSV